ncbi:RNA recognition motif family protein [Cryptosporidium felis]|nr:RNA recognition motif family protein [Cryptosporidium felis]
MQNLIKSIELGPTMAENHLRLIELCVKNKMSSKQVEKLYEGAISVCGLHPAEGPMIWSEYRRFLSQLNEGSPEFKIDKVRGLFYRQMSLPLSGLPDLLDEYRLWEEELPEESRESFEVAKNHYSKGQQEWSLRKPLEMKVQTDNVSNLQELFNAWIEYINFEKDRMLSIEYSSHAEPPQDCSESDSGPGPCHSSLEYKFGAKDSVIMAYRRALDDLGSLRVDLWLEFANFISTTTNCPHLLSTVYASSLQHFPANLKLWMLFFTASAEAAKDIVSHFSQFHHLYEPRCRTHSSFTWYPRSRLTLGVNSLHETLQTSLNCFLTELARARQVFTSEQDLLELFSIATNSLADVLKSSRNFEGSKKLTEVRSLPQKDGSISEGPYEDERTEELVSGVLERLYLEAEELAFRMCEKLEEESEEAGFLEDSLILFYSQRIEFERIKQFSGKFEFSSVLGGIFDQSESRICKLLPLIFSVAKRRLGVQEQLRARAHLEHSLSSHSERLQKDILADWDKAETNSRFSERYKRSRSDLTAERGLSCSPILRRVGPMAASSSGQETGGFASEGQQSVSLGLLQQGSLRLQPLSISSKDNFRSSVKDVEGDFVCLSEIRLRRDKRRNRRNLTESDYDTSSECSSESNGVSVLLPNPGVGGGKQIFRNFTPPGTPNYALHSFASSAAPQGQGMRSPCSPVGLNPQQGLFLPEIGNPGILTPRSSSYPVKSPATTIHDIEIRTQCTWDGREATEPSIAPPIPPIPPMLSVSSSSSVSSHSSQGNKLSERQGIQPIQRGELAALAPERLLDDSKMPPPPFTPKKNKPEPAGGAGNSQTLPSRTSSCELDVGSSHLGSGSEAGTLFVRFSPEKELDEKRLREVLDEHLPTQVSQVRAVRDFRGNSRGFAYVDVEPSKVEEIVQNADLLRVLEGFGIQISASCPPKTLGSRRESSTRSLRARRRTKKTHSDGQRSSDTTILVKNLDKTLDEAQVSSHFENGLGLRVKNILISRTQDGLSRGFGFVEFLSPEDALSAHMLNESMLGSKTITVSSSTRPLTFPRADGSEEGTSEILNARFAPRLKSKQKLPSNRRAGSEVRGSETELKPRDDGVADGSSSLTNEDFRKLFL